MTDINIDTPPGGIMTVEVGAITGPVTLHVTADGDTTRVRVRYQGADEDYEVTGSPLEGVVDADKVAKRLSTPPATIEGGNPPAVSL